MKKFHLLTLFILLAAPAFAVDGVTLINQSTVEAAGGFPYTITAPGSYKLSGSLVAPSGQAILVKASNVSIDLNGFDVTCTFPNPGSGSNPNLICIGDTGSIYVPSGISDVSVRNGSVTVNVTGTGTISSNVFVVGFYSTPNVIIEETHLEINASAVSFASILAWGANALIRHNVMSATGPEAGNVFTVAFFNCPALVIENINSTALSAGVIGTGCVVLNNFGI